MPLTAPELQNTDTNGIHADSAFFVRISSILNNIITSAIQGINGASLKDQWGEPERALGSTAKSGVQTAVSATLARYWPEI